MKKHKKSHCPPQDDELSDSSLKPTQISVQHLKISTLPPLWKLSVKGRLCYMVKSSGTSSAALVEFHVSPMHVWELQELTSNLKKFWIFPFSIQIFLWLLASLIFMLSHEALDNRFNKNALFITAFVQIKRLRRMGEDGFFFVFFIFRQAGGWVRNRIWSRSISQAVGGGWRPVRCLSDTPAV